MVGGKSARKLRLRLSHHRIVEMLLVGPLSDFRNLGVVDLDLVVNWSAAEAGPVVTKKTVAVAAATSVAAHKGRFRPLSIGT